MRRLLLLVLLAPAPARAQFVTSGADLDAPAGEALDVTKLIGRLSTSGLYYAESSTGDAMAANGDPASDVDLLYTDLRGHVEAEHIQGGRWDALADFRLRVVDDDGLSTPSARGYVGGSEADLREVYLDRRGQKTDVALGRIIVRDVDATTIDGLRLLHRASNKWELGAFAGLYPNQFSRSIATDYVDGVSPQDLPIGAGAWAGYRTPRVYGSLGVAGVIPRDETAVDPASAEPNRVFLTASGYARLRPGLDVFHYAVADVMGRAGTSLLNLQLGVHYRRSARFLLEAGASHLSTYAIELYVRDYLEAPDAMPQVGRIQNNVFLARMGSDEARGGATYSFLDKRVDVHAQLRYRRRQPITSDDLPPEIAGLPPDTQIDVSAGIRQRRSLGGFTLGANLLYIDGQRTSTKALTFKASRPFRNERFLVDLDATYLMYADQCPAAMADPTCLGQASGTLLETGAALLWHRDRHWLFLADYRLGKNSASVAGVPEPVITSQQFFARAQYSF